MTTINTIEDLHRILTENTHWREAIRAALLGDELLQLPAKFDRFVEQQQAFNAEQQAFNARVLAFIVEQQAFNARVLAFMADQQAFNAEMRAFVVEQRASNERHEAAIVQLQANVRRLDNNLGELKGREMYHWVLDEAPNIAMDMGLTYIRNLSTDEIRQMAIQAAQGQPLTPDLKSFRVADLIIEASDNGQTCYISVEASYTLDHRDTDRAIRNAALLTQFTGKPAKPAIAGVRIDWEINPQIESGQVFWYEMESPR